MTNRRRFLVTSLVGTVALGVSKAQAAGPMLSETEPQAQALGYVADTRRVDQKKYPKHVISQRCDNCALYQGKAGESAAACPLFAGKSVAGAGWCTAYAKRA